MKQLLLIATLLIALSASAQSKNDILIYSTQALSGYFDGLHEAIAYHGYGKGRAFWDYRTSWKRKYKNYDAGDTRAAFPGSKTVLVGFTDANHMTRTLSRGFMTGSIYFAMNERDGWKEKVVELLIGIIINRAGFVLAYNYIYK